MTQNLKREDINDKVSNTYIVRRRLADLAPRSGNCFDYYVGKFWVEIYTGNNNIKLDGDNRVTKHKQMEVHLYEEKRSSSGKLSYVMIVMSSDSRFANYNPIKCASNRVMPIQQLCELIKYLHKISKLTAFA